MSVPLEDMEPGYFCAFEDCRLDYSLIHIACPHCHKWNFVRNRYVEREDGNYWTRNVYDRFAFSPNCCEKAGMVWVYIRGDAFDSQWIERGCVTDTYRQSPEALRHLLALSGYGWSIDGGDAR